MADHGKVSESHFGAVITDKVESDEDAARRVARVFGLDCLAARALAEVDRIRQEGGKAFVVMEKGRWTVYRPAPGVATKEQS